MYQNSHHIHRVLKHITNSAQSQYRPMIIPVVNLSLCLLIYSYLQTCISHTYLHAYLHPIHSTHLGLISYGSTYPVSAMGVRLISGHSNPSITHAHPFLPFLPYTLHPTLYTPCLAILRLAEEISSCTNLTRKADTHSLRYGLADHDYSV